MVHSAGGRRRGRIRGIASGQGISRGVLAPGVSVNGVSKSDADAAQVPGVFTRLYANVLPITVATCAAIFVGIAYLALTPYVYVANTTIAFTPRPFASAPVNGAQNGPYADMFSVVNQIPVFSSNAVLGAVVDGLKLIQDPAFQIAAENGPRSWIETLTRTHHPTPGPRAHAIKRLRHSLRLQHQIKSDRLIVHVKSDSPIKAARLSNAIAKTYIAMRNDSKFGKDIAGNKARQKQLNSLRANLAKTQQRADEFRRASNTKIGPDGRNSETRLGTIATELATARAAAAEANARYALIVATLNSNDSPDSLQGALRSAVIQELRTQSAQISRRAAALAVEYHARHPKMKSIRAQQRDIENQIRRELKRIAAASKAEAEIAAKREAELVRALEHANVPVKSADDVQRKQRTLDREFEAARKALNEFYARAGDKQKPNFGAPPHAEVVARATVPSSPFWPRPFLVLAAAGLFGLVVGILSSIATKRTDTIISRHASSNAPGIGPILATLPILKPQHRSSQVGLYDIMLALAERQNTLANSFRQSVLQLLNRLLLDNISGGARTVLLVSPRVNAGTSSAVLALGYSAALAGDKVLVVDAASANPELSRVFGGKREHRMSVMLDNKKELAALTSVDGTTGLTVLPIALADLRTLNTAQRRRLNEGIRKLAADYELVLIDAGALLEDATVLNLFSAADRIVVVSRAGVTRKNELSQTVDLVKACSDNLLGTLVAMAPSSAV